MPHTGAGNREAIRILLLLPVIGEFHRCNIGDSDHLLNACKADGG